MVRLFVGIFPPENVRIAAVEAQKKLSTLPLDMKLVEQENIHISLSFLGETNEKEIPGLCRKLDEVCKKKAFPITISSVKTIPNRNYFRVLALGVESEEDALENLRKDVVKAVGGGSYPAHLTLARVREVKNKDVALEGIDKIEFSQEFTVDSVCLVKSVVTRNGPVYGVVHRSLLSSSSQG